MDLELGGHSCTVNIEQSRTPTDAENEDGVVTQSSAVSCAVQTPPPPGTPELPETVQQRCRRRSDEAPHAIARFTSRVHHKIPRDCSNISLKPLIGSVDTELCSHRHAYTGPAIVSCDCRESDTPLPAITSGMHDDPDCKLQSLVDIKIDKAEEAKDYEADNIGEEDDYRSSVCTRAIKTVQRRVTKQYSAHRETLRRIVLWVASCLFAVYLTLALLHDAHQAAPLVIMTSLVLISCLSRLVSSHCQNVCSWISNCTGAIKARVTQRTVCFKWLLLSVVLLGMLVYLATVIRSGKQLVSLCGYLTFLLLLFICSKHPSHVKLRTVLWGLGLQFLLAVVILRTSWGLYIFQYLGKRMSRFLSFADAGSKFVFGESHEDHFFAFKVLPVIVFFSCVISTLYYLGVMQCIISRIANIMQVTMGTTATESLIAASNIFVGQTEAPILVRPFIEQMTVSELHAMMTAGFATIAGGVLAAYILFGVPAEHLLCASVVNAPTALAVSKLVYPETQTPSLPSTILTNQRKERNIFEAASAGASASIKLVANIAANLIAFLALLAFVNSVFSWAGAFVGHPEISFQTVCSYIFLPVAALIGCEWQDCGHVAQLLGMKTFLNEFVAYEKLSQLIANRHACVEPAITSRSETLVAYALCGFANLSSIGIQLGGIGPMAPSRRGDLAAIAVRALIAGTVTCFITACVAGVLTSDEAVIECMTSNATNYDITTFAALETSQQM